jgi:hypothetical protein
MDIYKMNKAKVLCGLISIGLICTAPVQATEGEQLTKYTGWDQQAAPRRAGFCAAGCDALPLNSDWKYEQNTDVTSYQSDDSNKIWVYHGTSCQYYGDNDAHTCITSVGCFNRPTPGKLINGALKCP